MFRTVDMIKIKTPLLTALLILLSRWRDLQTRQRITATAIHRTFTASRQPGIRIRPTFRQRQIPIQNLLPITDLNPPPISVNQQPDSAFAQRRDQFGPSAPTSPILNFLPS